MYYVYHMENLNQNLNFKITDYDSEIYYPLLQQMPPELAKNHIRYIEAENMTNDEAISYLNEIVTHRHEAVATTVISDEKLKETLTDDPGKLFRALETSVFSSADNYLGTGMTAKVKYFEVHAGENTIPMAIKYVVTPTAKTITAEQEHNVIKEVEQMKLIETVESAFPRRSKYIRVPHPYLYHTTDKIQLYGMEMIDGITLEQACTEGMLHSDMKEALRNSRLAEVDIEELNGYVERFFNTMHEYCLHGDIKPRNIMISRDGVIYIIDFGQSIMCHNIPRGAENEFENLKDDEIKSVQLAVRTLLHKVFKED